MEVYTATNQDLKLLLDLMFTDFGHDISKIISKVSNEDKTIQLSTNYSNYIIKIIDEQDNFSHSCDRYKEILISNNKILTEPKSVKYFLRRQFIADEQLFNLYLRRGGAIKPHEAQEQALAQLQETRAQGLDRALVVFATGLGKTILSALDIKQTNSKRVLFIVHINEILRQTKETFEKVFPKRNSDMGYYTGKHKDNDKKILFASIQTMGRQKHIQNFPQDYFDYIIIDETHHTAAPTYNKIFEYFKPNFFLGLTATPYRMDQKDILGYYNNNVVYEIDQVEAIEQGYLAPFQYHGFKDNIDYSDIYFNGFRYDTKDLNKHLLIDARDDAIIKKFKEMAKERKTIGFCVSIEHVNRCVKKFNEAGISAIGVHSKSDGLEEYDDKSREMLIKHFRDGKCQIAFVVDMFNEGVDIPDVSCLLFLRPTESKTIFVQHMGRGLRISPRKENVLILDFIGNYKTANMILDGLSIENGARGLSKIVREGKEFFVYTLNGCEVTFESEVIDIFKSNEALYTKDIKKELINKAWVDYSGYLERWTKDNLYWKRGQQNQYFEVNFEALRILKNNPGISESNFVKEIQAIVAQKYPKKNMAAGFRALFISKISGFLSSDAPLRVMEPFEEIDKTSDLSDISSYEETLTRQLEKIFYWNSIYGSYNKYIDSSKRVSFKDFKIYPFFFIYNLLIKLIDEYGSSPYVTKFEFNTFIAIRKDHSEIKETAELILKYRADSERHQVKKLLESKNFIDPRFYSLVHYCKYFYRDKDGFGLKNEFIDEVRVKVMEFWELLDSNQLIMYEEECAQRYQSMLYSNCSLLDYHKKYKN